MEWIWNFEDIEEGRFTRSRKLKPVELNRENGSGVFEGSEGTYTCTLTHCTCQDFQYRLHGAQPCKHILSLGAALKAYDPDAVARRFEAEELKRCLAMAYGYYHLFHEPVLSNKDYDSMKARLAKIQSME